VNAVERVTEEALLHGIPRQSSDVRLARRLRPGGTGFVERAYPVCWWKRNDGVNRHALAAFGLPA
jgi:hypothetical protein